MRAKKHLGQHFLTSQQAIKDMITAAHVVAKDTVLEIGPGKGVLTKALLTTGARVVAIETDSDMIAILKDRFSDSIRASQLTLLEGDVLKEMPNIFQKIQNKKTHRQTGNTYKLVANIPYYITGEILRRFLTSHHQPSHITLLLQKEVAQRIACSKKESILSLSVKAYGTPRYVSTVPARYFSPAPKVDSAILSISDISRNIFNDISEDRFFKIVKSGFSSKRKQLVNNLSAFRNKEDIAHILTRRGLAVTIRAEDVSLSDWVSLCKEIT